MATYTRKQIADAKYGTHTIQMGMHEQPQPFVVVRVRDKRVQVQQANAVRDPIWLNDIASSILIYGGYRVR